MKYLNKTTLGFSLAWLALTVLLMGFHFWVISPLISNSDGGDIYVFFGKSAIFQDGKLPFRDINQSKGPLWFFLFAALNYLTPWSLLSLTVLIGICCLGLFFLSYKTARLFLSPFPAFLVSFFPILLLRFIRQNFPDTEFFLSILIMFGIYASCKLLLNHKMTKQQQWLWGTLNGVAFALAFWTKYQLIGLWLGLLSTIIILLITRKLPIKNFLSLLLSHIIGFSIPTLALLIYFGIHSAMGDLIYGYFFSRFDSAGSNPLDSSETAAEINPTSSVIATLDKSALYIYLISFGILAILTLVALIARNSFNPSIKVFIFNAIIFSLILILAMFILKDTESVGTRNFTAIICCSIIAVIYWVNWTVQKITQRRIFRIPRLAKTGLVLLLFGVIYLSGNIGTQSSNVQYIWDAQNSAIRLPNSTVEQLRDGPYYYLQMANWLKNHYPNSKFTTINPNLAFQLHQPFLLKYPYRRPNPIISSLHCQEIHDKITNGLITSLVTSIQISTPNQIATSELMHNQLETVYGENSSYQVSSLVLGHFRPVLAINQSNVMHVLWLRINQ